jgi:hypothetical protein
MNRDSVIVDMKELVEKGELDALKAYYESLNEEYEQVPWDYIYKAIYLHACLKKQHVIVDWLLELYKSFDEITTIALRQLFPYGRYLLNKGLPPK